MTSREGPIERAETSSDKIIRELGTEFRNGRLKAGLSQEVVARAIGVSRPTVSRMERGALAALPIRSASRFAAIVGLDLSVRCFAGGGPLTDQAHVRLLERLRARLEHAGWIWAYEVPLPGPQEQRAWDARLIHPTSGAVCVVEAETRIRDAQALARRQSLKHRDDPHPRHVLLVADSRNNRDAIRAAELTLNSLYPADPRRALAALAAGRAPVADALIVL